METNIYYNPEKFGLMVVDEIDLGGSYEFDKFVVWRTADGRLVYLTDSGCSCPTPFEEFGIDDVKEYSESAFDAWIEENKYRDIDNIDVLNFKQKMRGK